MYSMVDLRVILGADRTFHPLSPCISVGIHIEFKIYRENYKWNGNSGSKVYYVMYNQSVRYVNLYV